VFSTLDNCDYKHASSLVTFFYLSLSAVLISEKVWRYKVHCREFHGVETEVWRRAAEGEESSEVEASRRE